jgi:hypothetical protein
MDTHQAPAGAFDKADRLIAKVCLLRSNPHYRMSDVVYSKPYRYQDSAEKVLTLPEFEGSILKRYLLAVGGVDTVPNMAVLSELVDRVVAEKGYRLPEAGELVLHLRAGDVVQHDWFLSRDYAAEIERHGGAKQCTIVTCFAFQEFVERQWWMFTEEKLAANVARMRTLFADLLTRFPHIEFDVFSNRDIDQDFVYMVNAPLFIPDGGGFSELAGNVRAYRQESAA